MVPPGTQSSPGAPVEVSTVAQRAVRGSIASAISFFLSLAQTLLLVPVLLQSWGAERYGLWLALQSLYGLIIVLDTGHQTYVGNEFLRLFPTDRGRLRSTLAAGLLGALLLGTFQLAVVLGLTFSGALPWALGQGDQTLPDDAGSVLVLLLVVWIVLGSAGGVLGRLYPAAGQYARSIWLGVASRLLVTGALATAAFAGAGIFEAVLVSSIITLAYVVFLWRDLRRRFSNLYPFWQGARLREATKNIAHSVVLTGCALLVQLQQHGIIFVLSGQVGLAVIPAYTTTRTLANVFTQAASIVTGPLMPEMVRFSAMKQHQKLADTVRSIWFVTGVPVNFGLCLGLPLYEVLYTTWTRGKMPFDGALFALLAGAISVRCIGAPLTALLAGLNALRAQVWINAAQSAVVLGALLLAAPHWGVRAAGVAVALGEVIGSVVVPLMLMRRIEPEAMQRLRIRSLLVVMAPSTLVASTLLAVAAGLLPPITAAGGAVVLLALLYKLQWSGLALHVRIRLLGLAGLRRGPLPAAES